MELPRPPFASAGTTEGPALPADARYDLDEDEADGAVPALDPFGRAPRTGTLGFDSWVDVVLFEGLRSYNPAQTLVASLLGR